MRRRGAARGLAGIAGRPALDVLGMAATSAPTGASVDPLDPARAVRRALADAGRKAVEVGVIVVASPVLASAEPIPAVAGTASEDGSLEAFVRVALGPGRERVERRAVAGPEVIAALVAALGTEAAGGLGIAVLGSSRRTVALCLARSALDPTRRERPRRPRISRS